MVSYRTLNGKCPQPAGSRAEPGPQVCKPGLPAAGRGWARCQWGPRPPLRGVGIVAPGCRQPWLPCLAFCQPRQLQVRSQEASGSRRKVAPFQPRPRSGLPGFPSPRRSSDRMEAAAAQGALLWRGAGPPRLPTPVLCWPHHTRGLRPVPGGTVSAVWPSQWTHMNRRAQDSAQGAPYSRPSRGVGRWSGRAGWRGPDSPLAQTGRGARRAWSGSGLSLASSRAPLGAPVWPPQDPWPLPSEGPLLRPGALPTRPSHAPASRGGLGSAAPPLALLPEAAPPAGTCPRHS